MSEPEETTIKQSKTVPVGFRIPRADKARYAAIAKKLGYADLGSFLRVAAEMKAAETERAWAGVGDGA